ncbi:MAG: AgmX/PglI C-terminal domain-containing protein [Nannocystaceae bacterium]
MNITIDIFRNGEHIETLAPEVEVIKIGRLRSNHVVLAGDSVARVHAAIEITRGAVELLDLGDPSGVIVNGRRVDRRAALADGDALVIGEYRLALRITATQAASASSAELSRMIAGPALPAATGAASAVHERCDGTAVAEVFARFGDTVVDVQHIAASAPRSRHLHWLALGGALTLGGVALFAHEQSHDWEAAHAAAVDAELRGEEAPAAPGTGLGGLGGALALLGLVPLAFGLIGARDRVRDAYSIGESPAASFPVSGRSLPDPAAFPLVERRGDHLALCFTSAMEGAVELGDDTVELEALARSGRTDAAGDRHAYALPLGARGWVKHGDLTFEVRAVRPAALSVGRDRADRAFWGYNAGALVVIGALITTSQMIPDDPQGILDEASIQSNRFVGYLSQADLQPEVEVAKATVQAPVKVPSESSGTRHRGHEGAAGSPKSAVQEGAMAIKSIGKVTGVDRNFDPERRAERSGILGVFADNSGSPFASALAQSYASGDGDEDVWGDLTSQQVGESHGVGGLGLVGTGRSGGGQAEGALGLGNVGLIGRCGPNGCQGAVGEYGGGGTTTFAGRAARAPQVRVSTAEVTGALDKDVVRRIVRAHINEVRHCYNQALVHDPLLRGRVAIQFSIGAGGDVLAANPSESSVKDPTVGRCIAQAVRRWKFPKPQGGGSVIVTYPFVLESGRS